MVNWQSYNASNFLERYTESLCTLRNMSRYIKNNVQIKKSVTKADSNISCRNISLCTTTCSGVAMADYAN